MKIGDLVKRIDDRWLCVGIIVSIGSLKHQGYPWAQVLWSAGDISHEPQPILEVINEKRITR